MTSPREAANRTAKARRLAAILDGYSVSAAVARRLPESTWETIAAIDAHREGRRGRPSAPSAATRAEVCLYLPAAEMTEDELEAMFA